MRVTSRTRAKRFDVESPRFEEICEQLVAAVDLADALREKFTRALKHKRWRIAGLIEDELEVVEVRIRTAEEQLGEHRYRTAGKQ